MLWRVQLAAILLAATLIFNSCGDRRPIWSLSAAAVAELQLDASATVEEGRIKDPTAGSCRAVLSLRVPSDGLASALPSEELRSILVQATNIRLECIGGCGNTDSCRTHHRVESPGSQWATTGCTCDPASPSPCRLDLRWAPGETSRRKIDQIFCGEHESDATCRIDFFRDGTDLQIACKSQEYPVIVDSSSGR